jgi:catechol 2,3-dioxygenase-like lactoylglutathione lyase family enzyme
MKRFHVHVSVPDLDASIRFYSTLFGTEPAVVKGDYAKWMLEDPRVNFAISQRGGKAGLNHLGLQTDSDEELELLNGQLQQADLSTHAEKETACCYARSNKYWVTDPTGIAWETFHTLAEVPTFNGEGETASASTAAACCAPEAPSARLASRIPVKAAAGCCS